MEVKTCKRCRKFFNYITGPYICPVCKEKIEQDFQKVKKYIDDNPGADIKEVAEACEVDPQQIRQWIREERLQFSDDSPIRIACEACGSMIRSGRYCDACKNEMASGMKSAFGLNKPAPEPVVKKRDSDGNKMRFL